MIIFHKPEDAAEAREAASRVYPVEMTTKATPRKGSTGKVVGEKDKVVISGDGER